MLGEKEFTKLQGYIGKQYALASGEVIRKLQKVYLNTICQEVRVINFPLQCVEQ